MKIADTSFKEKLQNYIKKETLAQVFSCEFCEIFTYNYFIEHVRTTASVFLKRKMDFVNS